MSAVQLQQAHAAYTQLAAIYEDVCGGPYKAREFKEYFAIMDSRTRISQRFIALNQGRHGDEQ